MFGTVSLRSRTLYNAAILFGSNKQPQVGVYVEQHSIEHDGWSYADEHPASIEATSADDRVTSFRKRPASLTWRH